MKVRMYICYTAEVHYFIDHSQGIMILQAISANDSSMYCKVKDALIYVHGNLLHIVF